MVYLSLHWQMVNLSVFVYLLKEENLLTKLFNLLYLIGKRMNNYTSAIKVVKFLRWKIKEVESTYVKKTRIQMDKSRKDM